MSEDKRRRTDQMDDLRQEYEQLHMSSAQVEKMKEKIHEAKTENQNARIIQMGKRGNRWIKVLSTAAAVALVFIVLPNTSAGVAHAMEQIPILGNLVKVVTFRDYQYDSKRNMADVEVPQLTSDGVAENAPTQEALDPVRYITNHSTGKMGYALARMAMLRGAEVTLVSGPVSIAPPPFIRLIPIVSARDMFEAITANAADADYIFMAAAVADYTPARYVDDKIKKHDGDLSIPLQRTKDILAYLGEHRSDNQIICGFSMETRDMLENSRAKLQKKKVDMICANNLKVPGAGFGVDTNVITMITRDEITQLPLLTKEETANAILDKAIRLNK